MEIFSAPIQGYTDAPYRHFHAQLYTPADTYCSPFIHIEHGEPRKRDIRDITSPLNDNHRLIPQILFKDFDEFILLTKTVADAGYNVVDLNLGCPFPPQVKKGRGAGLLTNQDCLRQVAEHIKSDTDMKYSLKMRLGINDCKEWRGIATIINSMPLSHVTIHPRISVQQYSGDLYMEEFEEALNMLNHPVIFNGDVRTPEDIESIASRYPSLHGVMVGRGLLARPSIIEEWRNKKALTDEEQIERLLNLHAELMSHYESHLCGDAQILSKIKPFWEYAENLIGRKSAKLIRKSGSINSYRNAISTIGNI